MRDIICSHSLGHQVGRSNSVCFEISAVKEFQVQIAAFGLDAVQRGAVRHVAKELGAEDQSRSASVSNSTAERAESTSPDWGPETCIWHRMAYNDSRGDPQPKCVKQLSHLGGYLSD